MNNTKILVILFIFAGLFCDRKWDEMLCWPVMPLNQTVAIPCKDSKQFVELIKESRPAIEPNDIPGKTM